VTLVREELTRHKDLDLTVDAVATGGHRVPDLLARLEQDVIPKKPTIVFIQIGVNDAARGNAPEQFRDGLNELIDKLQATGARVVLCTCTSLGEKRDGANPIDDKLAKFADVARAVAKEQKVPLNDLHKAFRNYWNAHNPENKESGILTYDGNHFNDAGHKFVAEQMLKKLK
jgi:lysophospholipase L1-like esterase